MAVTRAQAAPPAPRRSSLARREVIDVLRRRMREHGLTFQDLVQRIALKRPSYLSVLFSGRIDITQSRYFEAICQALGLSTEEQGRLQLGAHHQRTPPTPAPVAFQTPLDVRLYLMHTLSSHGLTVPDLAAQLGCRATSLAQYFTGRQVLSHSVHFEPVCDALRVPPHLRERIRNIQTPARAGRTRAKTGAA